MNTMVLMGIFRENSRVPILRRNNNKNEAEDSVVETIDCLTDWQPRLLARA